MLAIELRDVRSVVARHPLATAFAISLVIHALLFSGYRLGKQLGWWQHQATWLLQWHKKRSQAALARAQAQQAAQMAQREIPLTFVEVDPATPATEAPKDAKYYGVANTRATNPDARLETEIPKLEGKQQPLTRLEDIPKPKPFPLQPAVEPPAPAEAEAKPKSAAPPGDLAMATASDLLKKSDGVTDAKGEAPTQTRERPRTLAQARAQKNLTGQRSQQDGGVRARGRVSLDVKATPFGAYDAAFIAAVQQRWYDLLESSHFVQQSGKVVLEFKLTYDGRIVGMQVADQTVNEILTLLCQKAVLDPAPYAKWPPDMRRMIGSNFREVTFTFYYN